MWSILIYRLLIQQWKKKAQRDILSTAQSTCTRFGVLSSATMLKNTCAVCACNFFLLWDSLVSRAQRTKIVWLKWRWRGITYQLFSVFHLQQLFITLTFWWQLRNWKPIITVLTELTWRVSLLNSSSGLSRERIHKSIFFNSFLLFPVISLKAVICFIPIIRIFEQL